MGGGGGVDPLKLGITGGWKKFVWNRRRGMVGKQEMGALIWVGGRLMILHQLFLL